MRNSRGTQLAVLPEMRRSIEQRSIPSPGDGGRGADNGSAQSDFAGMAPKDAEEATSGELRCVSARFRWTRGRRRHEFEHDVPKT